MGLDLCRWAFDVVLDALVARFQTELSAPSSDGSAAAGIADALTQLAQGVRGNKQASAAMFRRLLSLHNEAASAVLSAEEHRPGGSSGSPAARVAALRRLTPALAEAAESMAAAEGAADSRQGMVLVRITEDLMRLQDAMLLHVRIPTKQNNLSAEWVLPWQHNACDTPKQPS